MQPVCNGHGDAHQHGCKRYGAGIRSGLSFPEVVAQSLPEIASDPEGFDRAAFHDVMNSTIVTFFKQALSDCVGK